MTSQKRKKGNKRRKKKRPSRDPFKPGFWKSHWREALILFGLAIVLYIRCLPYEFVLDDQIVISDNAFTKSGIDGIDDIFANDSFTGYFGEQKTLVAGARYRPLSIAMFAVEYEFAGARTWIYHLGNIIWYALLGLMVFRVTHLFVNDKAKYWYLSVPFIAGLLFVTHPVHSEAVANIKGRDEILSMIGALAALYAALRYCWKGSNLWLVLSGVFLLLGLMAKENAITYVAIIPFAAYFFTRTKPRTWLLATVPSLVAALLYIFIRYQVIGFLLGGPEVTDLMNNPFVEMTAAQKYATITFTLGWYLKLLVFPHPLTHDYYPYHVPVMNWSDPLVILSMLLLLALASAALYGLRRKTMMSFAVIYFFATISIVSNVLFPVGTFMNERFIFMPSLAICIALPYYAEVLVKKWDHRPKWGLYVLLGIVIAGFSARTITRVPVWRNQLTLNTAGVAVSPGSARANTFMATALYKEAADIDDREERIRRMREAREYIERALEINPNYYSANQMKSGIVAEYYRYDGDLDKLLQEFETILSVKPNIEYVRQYCEYLNGRGVPVNKLLAFYYRVGYELLHAEKREYQWAKVYLDLGLALQPRNALLNWASGKNYEAMGNAGRAEEYLNRAYQFDPSLRAYN